VKKFVKIRPRFGAARSTRRDVNPNRPQDAGEVQGAGNAIETRKSRDGEIISLMQLRDFACESIRENEEGNEAAARRRTD